MSGGGGQEAPPHPKIYWQLMVAANGATVLSGAGRATVPLHKPPPSHVHTASLAVDHKTVQKDIDIEGRFRRMNSVAEEG